MEKPTSLHNLKMLMERACKVKGRSGPVIKPEGWVAAITKCFKKHTTVKKTCLCLVEAPVTIFKELELIEGTD